MILVIHNFYKVSDIAFDDAQHKQFAVLLIYYFKACKLLHINPVQFQLDARTEGILVATGMGT